jgi:hypothetical protein
MEEHASRSKLREQARALKETKKAEKEEGEKEKRENQEKKRARRQAHEEEKELSRVINENMKANYIEQERKKKAEKEAMITCSLCEKPCLYSSYGHLLAHTKKHHAGHASLPLVEGCYKEQLIKSKGIKHEKRKAARRRISDKKK